MLVAIARVRPGSVAPTFVGRWPSRAAAWPLHYSQQLPRVQSARRRMRGTGQPTGHHSV